MAYLGYVFFVSFWGYYFLFGFLVVCGVVARLLVVLGNEAPIGGSVREIWEV